MRDCCLRSCPFICASEGFGCRSWWSSGRCAAHILAFHSSALVNQSQESALSFSQMAVLVSTGVIAWNALYDNIPMRPGRIVL